MLIRLYCTRRLLVLGFMVLRSAVVLAGSYNKVDDGIVVHIDANKPAGSRSVKLQVVSDKIMRVIADPDIKDANLQPSLIVTNANRLQTKWNLIENDSTLIIQTAYINAAIKRASGIVVFTDKAGKLILQEADNGRSFKQVNIDGAKSFATRQSFLSPANEAFYGLGQHQQGVMNYKEENVELVQNNTEVAVPFLVSNKNYGLLWDNCSITKFGDGRDYQPLSSLKLYDNKGVPGALTATYYAKDTPSHTYLQKKESAIEYEYLSSLKNVPEAFPMGNGKVKWEGKIASGQTGTHKLSVKYAGYVKVWIAGKLVLDRWRQPWNPATAIIDIVLQKDKKYPVKIDWTPDGGESFLTCRWLSPRSATDKSRFSFNSEAGDKIDYYFIYGQNADEVISGYRTLTGKAPIMPKWAMGLWQSRERYKTQNEVLSVVKEFREKKIPLDNIVMDWQYWKPDQWGSQDFDTSRFADASGMIQQLHNEYNTHFMVSVWPKFYTGNQNYDLFQSKGWLYTKNVENHQKDWLGYVSTFYDAFNPEARKGFWDLVNKHLFSKGVDAWWLDASEPDIYSNASIAERKQLMSPGSLGSSTKYFNAFPLENARAIYEGQRNTDSEKRVFILTRSGFAGLQRYASAVWSGDIAARWSDMKTQIPAGINFSMSGLPYWTMDIGGFAVESRYEHAKGSELREWQEQMTRWYQFGAFCPLFRVHGQFPYREIFNVAKETDTAYKSMLYYDKLRYRLMPYIYTLAGKGYHDDYTIMRGLIMDFPHDLRVMGIGDQYMFGPSLLVSPVYEYNARSRKVYLPEGTGWYNLYTGVHSKGGQDLNVAAPYDKIPVFVKEGAIIPLGPDMLYSTEKQADTISLFVYAGKDGAFTLYEDENINFHYEDGAFANITFNYNEESKSITIDERKGTFPGMLQKRVFNIIWITKETPLALDPAEKTYMSSVEYTGNKITVLMKKG